MVLLQKKEFPLPFEILFTCLVIKLTGVRLTGEKKTKTKLNYLLEAIDMDSKDSQGQYKSMYVIQNQGQRG